jgi:hypothetical protein
MTLPWENPPDVMERRRKGLPDYEKPPLRPDLAKDPVTGLWPGQRTPEDLPDFLRRTA